MKQIVRLWLDDVRDPVTHGHIGWLWVKTYEEAIEAFQKYDVIEASLDHDLGPLSAIGIENDVELSGYDVVKWMEENNVYPIYGVSVHSMNPIGAKRMKDGLNSIKRRMKSGT